MIPSHWHGSCLTRVAWKANVRKWLLPVWLRVRMNPPVLVAELTVHVPSPLAGLASVAASHLAPFPWLSLLPCNSLQLAEPARRALPFALEPVKEVAQCWGIDMCCHSWSLALSLSSLSWEKGYLPKEGERKHYCSTQVTSHMTKVHFFYPISLIEQRKGQGWATGDLVCCIVQECWGLPLII